MSEIKHRYTRNMVCPYCGHENMNSWDYMSGEEDLGEVECGECGKDYEAQRIVTVEYKTEKIDEES
jgi:transcription elongation factor Elf1